MHISDLERFIAKTKFTNDCWNWVGTTDKKGYGRFFINGAVRYAHRISYSWFNGCIPNNLTIDHECENKSCVRPEHLSIKTSRENKFSSYGSTEDFCCRGHIRSEHGFYNSQGHLTCRICQRAANTRSRNR